MSIKKIEMLTVVCDNCKKSADEDTEYYCWNDDSYAKEIAKESGYIEHENFNYCLKCYSYDDNDNLILKQIKQK